MNPFTRTILIFIVGMVALQAATRRDITILEASEKIKYTAQELSEEYAYYYTHPYRHEYGLKIQQEIRALEEGVRIIARTTGDNKIRQMLNFLSYEKEQLKIPAGQTPTRDNLVAVLNSSDAFDEGASKIASWIKYESTFEERMFMRCKSINYLLKKISAYYVVLGSDINKISIVESMNETIKTLDREMNNIQAYQYPAQFTSEKKTLKRLWNFSKKHYTNTSNERIPGVLLIAQNGIERIVNELAGYHSKH